jgi:hypothetical protein
MPQTCGFPNGNHPTRMICQALTNASHCLTDVIIIVLLSRNWENQNRSELLEVDLGYISEEPELLAFEICATLSIDQVIFKKR